jgi:hypothetical protein
MLPGPHTRRARLRVGQAQLDGWTLAPAPVGELVAVAQQVAGGHAPAVEISDGGLLDAERLGHGALLAGGRADACVIGADAAAGVERVGWAA